MSFLLREVWTSMGKNNASSFEFGCATFSLLVHASNVLLGIDCIHVQHLHSFDTIGSYRENQELTCNELAWYSYWEKFEIRWARSIQVLSNSHVQHARWCMLAIRTYKYYAKTRARATRYYFEVTAFMVSWWGDLDNRLIMSLLPVLMIAH